MKSTKKLITPLINADEVTKKVRKIIKTDIWKKQDEREGFVEKFEPLLWSDNKQNETLKEIQNKQIVLIDILNKNRNEINEKFGKKLKKLNLQHEVYYDAVDDKFDYDEYYDAFDDKALFLIKQRKKRENDLERIKKYRSLQKNYTY